MRPWLYRCTAALSASLGVTLFVVVVRAVYMRDHGAQTLMFRLGMPLVLLATLGGGLLIGIAGLLLATARHRSVTGG